MSKRHRFSINPLLATLLACFAAGTLSTATPGEPEARELEMAARDWAPAGEAAAQFSRVEPPAIVTNAPAELSAEEKALLEEMKAARQAGELAVTKEIADAPAGGHELPPGVQHSASLDACIAGETSGGADPLFWGDVLVVDNSPEIEGHPDMVCSDSGRCYVTFEGMNTDCVYVYRSTNGGRSWSFMLSICGGGFDWKDPALAVPEVTEDYLFWVYENEAFDRIELSRYDLATGEWLTIPVESNPPMGAHRPRIVTDNHDYGDYYLYVTYERETLVAAGPEAPGADPTEVRVARSTDQGVTWTNFGTLYTPSAYSEPLPRPDIAYGQGNVYVTWAEKVWWPTEEMNVHLARSTNFGVSWGADLDLTASDSYSCFDPRIAVIQDSDEVLVAYTKDYTTDVDVWYGYSTDGGGSWSTNHCLECIINLDEERPDLCVDPSLGNFHVAYWKKYDIRYAHAPRTNPTAWSAKETINDTGDASRSYHPPTVAVDFGSGEAGVAWSDFRTPTYAIYFDRADWAPTVACSYTCVPASGTTPFVTTMTVMLTNAYTEQLRRIAGRIDLVTAAGSFFSNWRSGYTNVAAGGSYVTAWSQTIPALGALIGTNLFRLAAQDVTPSPFNQPPYPPSGDLLTDTCTVDAASP